MDSEVHIIASDTESQWAFIGAKKQLMNLARTITDNTRKKHDAVIVKITIKKRHNGWVTFLNGLVSRITGIQ